tara:strand:- start:51 stop:224 length:174 start_codon:yes stop_codon:yes gene_type:complete
MDAELKKKAETMFYFLTKEAARNSFADFLYNSGVSDDEWQAIKAHITEKTSIEFKYL